MFVSGTSTHKVGEVAQTLLGVELSASSVSRLNQTLTQQFEAWRERRLQTHWRIMYLDGIHLKIRHGDKCDTSIICHVSSFRPDLTAKLTAETEDNRRKPVAWRDIVWEN